MIKKEKNMPELNVDFKDADYEAFCEETEAENDDPLDSLSPVKKNMVLFFVIDVSASMRGNRIETMNKAMQDVLPELIGVGGSNTDVRVAVLTFGSGTEWITSEPMLLEEYQNWRDLQAEGVTDLGAALLELNEKMSRKSFLQSPSLSYAPVIFLITDGCPTDNYKAGLEVLRKNNWFRYGIKIALALGKGVDLDVLEEFTGDREFVVQANNLKQMKLLVQAIAVTSSQIGSSSMQVEVQPSVDTTSLDEKQVDGMKKEQMKDVLSDLKAEMLEDMDFDEGW
jgi:uncharacterized protein YegL